MTVYARSDVLHVALSAAHGGCGASHSRPVTHGAPVKEWSLTCPACEAHLRHDPHWASFPSEVPETPDEARVREDREGKGALDRDNQLLQALVTLARSNEGIQQLLLAGSSGDTTVAVKRCTSGHLSVDSARFCGDCGESLDAPRSLTEAETAMISVVTAPPKFDRGSLRQQSVARLRELAKSHGVVTTGTKVDLITRLTAV